VLLPAHRVLAESCLVLLLSPLTMLVLPQLATSLRRLLGLHHLGWLLLQVELSMLRSCAAESSSVITTRSGVSTVVVAVAHDEGCVSISSAMALSCTLGCELRPSLGSRCWSPECCDEELWLRAA
jgi:hypothetical protein